MTAPRLTLTRFRRSAAILMAGFALVVVSGCGGSDDDGENQVAGTFVGKVAGTKAFVAVAASPAAEGKDERNVTVYVCDASRVCEWFRSSETGNGFEATSDDRDSEAKGELSDKAVTGDVKLPNGKTVQYKASPAQATAGLYELTVSSDGELRGASAAGVGLTGKSTLPAPGTGTLKLADGKRLKIVTTTDSAGDAPRLRAGQVRLIVLTGGQLRGAGKSRRTADGGDSDFFIRSSSQ